MHRLQRALEIAGAVAFLVFIPILHFEHVYSARSAQLLMTNIHDLERKGQARTLTKQQRDHIISELLPYNGHAGVMIYEESSETEVQAFASQLASVLRDSGWSVNVAQAELVKGQPFYGLKVDVGDFYNPPVSATALVKALRGQAFTLMLDSILTTVLKVSI